MDNIEQEVRASKRDFKPSVVIEFSLRHEIEAVKEPDGLYMVSIDGKPYAIGVTLLYTMWIAIVKYNAENKK